MPELRAFALHVLLPFLCSVLMPLNPCQWPSELGAVGRRPIENSQASVGCVLQTIGLPLRSLSLSGSNLYHQLNVFGADEDDERAASGEGPLPRAGCPQRKAGSVQGKCKQGHAPAIPSLRFHGFLLILQPVEPAPNPAASRVGGVSQRSRLVYVCARAFVYVRMCACMRVYACARW